MIQKNSNSSNTFPISINSNFKFRFTPKKKKIEARPGRLFFRRLFCLVYVARSRWKTGQDHHVQHHGLAFIIHANEINSSQVRLGTKGVNSSLHRPITINHRDWLNVIYLPINRASFPCHEQPFNRRGQSIMIRPCINPQVPGISTLDELCLIGEWRREEKVMEERDHDELFKNNGIVCHRLSSRS